MALRAGLLASFISVAALSDWASAAEMRARGVVRSLLEASISSELSARINAIPFREGQGFRQGDLLVEFDCVRMAAEVAALAAEESAARAAHEGNREMEKFKAIGARDLAVSAARLERASAEHLSVRAKMAACRIVAPYDGVVVEKTANVHEVSSPAAPLLRIVNVQKLEIELIAPSNWLRWLAEGASFTFKVDETGQTYPARVIRLPRTVDPVSQTIKVFAEIENPTAAIWPGMSGSALFDRAGG